MTLEQIRTAKKLTKGEMAKALNMSISSYIRYAKNKTPNIPTANFLLMADNLNLSNEELSKMLAEYK